MLAGVDFCDNCQGFWCLLSEEDFLPVCLLQDTRYALSSAFLVAIKYARTS